VVDPPPSSPTGHNAFVQAMASLGAAPGGASGLNPISGRHDSFGDGGVLSVANPELRRL